MRIFTAFLIIALLASCNPLRKIQRTERADSTAIDRSEVHKTVIDIAKEQRTMVQTVIEYYPPVSVAATGPPAQTPFGPEGIGPTTPAPAVKRIIRTEITSAREQKATTDSTAHNDVAVTLKTDTSDKVVEKPPAGVTALKWIAAGLAALLLIIIAIRKLFL